MTKQNIITILAIASFTTLGAHPSQANEQGQITFTGTVSPQCSIVMLNNISSVSSNLAQSIDSPELPLDPTVVSNNQPTSEIISIGNQKSIYESILANNQQANVKFQLIGNKGSVTTICNTSSNLSVSIDRVASDLTDPNIKIRFASGGNGVYQQAGKDQNYQDTATFASHGVTTATGDTAFVEVNLPETNTNPIFVYASLTAQ